MTKAKTNARVLNPDSLVFLICGNLMQFPEGIKPCQLFFFAVCAGKSPRTRRTWTTATPVLAALPPDNKSGIPARYKQHTTFYNR